MKTINEKNIITPAGIELTLEAEKLVDFLPDMEVLSIGCGTGDIESYLAQKYQSKITGIDIDSEKLKTAQKKQLTNLNFIAGDGNCLPFSSEIFEIVYCCGSLSYLKSDGFQEINRVLKENGKVIVIEATYMENTIPEEVIAGVQKNGFQLLNIMTIEEINRRFQSNRINNLFTKIYFEPLWWKNIDHDNRKLLSLYQKHLAVGLFIFEKVNQDYQI
jgi:ubiquinone/menaquinone biosynthesis C-methylase UbiE